MTKDIPVPPGTKMWDTGAPTFSAMILGWLDGLVTTEQIEFMKRVGVPADRREEYLKAIGGDPVVSLPQPPPCLTGSLPVVDHVDITPTMAMKGAPDAPDRPEPKVKTKPPIVDLKKQAQ